MKDQFLDAERGRVQYPLSSDDKQEHVRQIWRGTWRDFCEVDGEVQQVTDRSSS